jgi:DNA helicase-2/ATP-dependent DNA helicase PcrA
MGRELTYFNGELSYDGLLNSLRTRDIAYTLEFFPEEGKYHHSGHRKCGVSLSPDQVAEGRRAMPEMRTSTDSGCAAEGTRAWTAGCRDPCR